MTISRFAEAALALDSGLEALKKLRPPHDFNLIIINLRLADIHGYGYYATLDIHIGSWALHVTFWPAAGLACSFSSNLHQPQAREHS